MLSLQNRSVGFLSQASMSQVSLVQSPRPQFGLKFQFQETEQHKGVQYFHMKPMVIEQDGQQQETWEKTEERKKIEALLKNREVKRYVKRFGALEHQYDRVRLALRFWKDGITGENKIGGFFSGYANQYTKPVCIDVLDGDELESPSLFLNAIHTVASNCMKLLTLQNGSKDVLKQVGYSGEEDPDRYYQLHTNGAKLKDSDAKRFEALSSSAFVFHHDKKAK